MPEPRPVEINKKVLYGGLVISTLHVLVFVFAFDKLLMAQWVPEPTTFALIFNPLIIFLQGIMLYISGALALLLGEFLLVSILIVTSVLLSEFWYIKIYRFAIIFTFILFFLILYIVDIPKPKTPDSSPLGEALIEILLKDNK